MTLKFLEAHPNKRGPGFVAWAIGQPEDHLMDYRGCNFRRLRVPGLGAAATLDELAANVRAAFPMKDDLRKAVRGRTGTHMPDETPTEYRNAGKCDLDPWKGNV